MATRYPVAEDEDVRFLCTANADLVFEHRVHHSRVDAVERQQLGGRVFLADHRLIER